jgi:hypothetical protein
VVELAARLAPNWTTVAGGLEGILDFYELSLPRYAIMGLTGHAWHFQLAEREGVVALPSGPTDIDWDAMLPRYARTGLAWERFSGDASNRLEAVAWARGHLDESRPLLGWDFHMHDFGLVYGYDAGDASFLVDDPLTPQVGARVEWEGWPSATLDRIELFAPVGPVEVDAEEAVLGSLNNAVVDLAATTSPNRGTAGIERWAAALESDLEVDRAGNAYTLQVLQAGRMDGADYLASLVEVFPGAAKELARAERATRDEIQALAPLITLFPFPTGGHGNVANPGLREAAASALRRAAAREREAVEALRLAVRTIEGASDA